jgi:hypothetical protein
MSLITDVVVVAMFNEDAAIAHVNAHLAATDSRKQQLEPLDMNAAGGTKVSSARVYAAAFNYVDWPGLRDALLAAPWRLPEDVTVCVDGEGFSERFTPATPPVIR